jgi:hypothetical protein
MSDGPDGTQARMRAWLLAQKDYEATFEEGPLDEIPSKDASGHFTIPAKDVPGLLFNDGPTSVAAIQAYLRANADPFALEEYGAFLLRQAGGITPDGAVDLAVLDRWEVRYSGALSVLPGLQSKLDAARKARIALDKAIADKETALDYIRLSPAMLFVDHDPMTATEKFFELPDTTAAMHALVERMNGNQQAIGGLRKSVADFIRDKIGVTNDRAAEYLAFMVAHEQALAVLFEAAKMQTLRDIGADLKRCLPSPIPMPEIRERLPISAPKRGWRGLFGR